MTALFASLYADEAGFIVSAELVLVATIAVLALVVGLSEVAHAVNQELEDVATAFGTVNQSYRYQGLTGHQGAVGGGKYRDSMDFCDSDRDIVCDAPTGESGGYYNGY